MLRIGTVLVSIVLFGYFCVGCDTRRAQLAADLKELGYNYHLYHDDHGRGPADWDELMAFTKARTSGTAYIDAELTSMERLRDEEYQVKWGVRFHDLVTGDWTKPTKSMREKFATFVLAQGADGDPVLMMDCVVVRGGKSRDEIPGSADASIAYQPHFVPIILSVNSSGEVSLQGSTSVTTVLGTFSLGAGYTLKPEQGFTHVIIRDRRRGAADQEIVYRVHSGDRPLTVVYDGETHVTVQDRRVVIDVSDGVARDVKIDGD